MQPVYERIHGKIRVKGPVSREDLERLKEVAESASPVKDSLRAAPSTSELIVEK